MDLYHHDSQSANVTVHLAAPSLNEIASRMSLYAYTLLAFSLIVFARRWYFVKGNELVNAPFVGAKPGIIARYRFFKHAPDYIQGGYDKVDPSAIHQRSKLTLSSSKIRYSSCRDTISWSYPTNMSTSYETYQIIDLARSKRTSMWAES